jgi:putative membrane protein
MSGNGMSRMGLALVAAAAIGACAKKDAGYTDTGIAGTSTDTGVMAGMSETDMAGPAAGMSDANIVFALDNANKLDSAAGSIAATKGTSADVRDFARRMMGDHHRLRQQGQDLAKKLGVSPVPPPNDSSQAQMNRTMALLNGAAKGRDFDKAYIDNEVTAHMAVLDMATAAGNAAQNAELKNLIQKAAPVIQTHLDNAKSIQGKMK